MIEAHVWLAGSPSAADRLARRGLHVFERGLRLEPDLRGIEGVSY